jgi:hypothetical protein
MSTRCAVAVRIAVGNRKRFQIEIVPSQRDRTLVFVGAMMRALTCCRLLESGRGSVYTKCAQSSDMVKCCSDKKFQTCDRLKIANSVRHYNISTGTFGRTKVR